MAYGRNQVLDQPALERPRIGVAVRIERRQFGILPRFVLVVLILKLIVLQLGRLRRRSLRLRCLCLEAVGPAVVKQRHHHAGILTGAPGDFTAKPAFSQVAAADAAGELLQMLQDPRDVPAAADKVPDDGMKEIAAVGAFRRAGAHDLLDLLDAVATSVTVEAVACNWCSSFCSC